MTEFQDPRSQNGGQTPASDDVLLAWWDGVAGGPANMGADEVLAAEAARLGRPLLRLYRWESPTVSLGGFQTIAEARATSAIAGVPLVRRSSGGGALVHGTDLTYALAVPRGHPWARRPLPLYDAVHEALVAVLADHGVAARRHAGRPASPHDPFFCFSRRAVGDVVAVLPDRCPGEDDPKILGSAQRRLATAVIQHGSLLLAANADVGAAARHPGLAEVGCRAEWAAIRRLGEAWVGRIAAACGLRVEWCMEAFLAGREEAVAAAASRFAASRWLERR